MQSKEDGEDPLCCPMDRTSLDGLPPALFIVAECDILADQSAGMWNPVALDATFLTHRIVM